MADMVIFIPDKADTARWETIGSGRCLYLRYRKRRGLFAEKRTKRYLQKAKGCSTSDAFWAKKLGLPLLSGSGTELVLALCDRLVPEAAAEKCLALSVGERYDAEAIIRIARRVRTMELIAPESAASLAETIEEETGLSVPIFPAYRPGEGKIALRLPGGADCGKDAIDVSCPDASCLFAPPSALRPLCTHVGSDGDTLAALLPFFGFSYGDAGIFLSKSTK